jgi:maleamate amidohydrolase
VIPREAVGDRDPRAHEQALHDVDAKYGDVLSLEDTIGWMTALPRPSPTAEVAS